MDNSVAYPSLITVFTLACMNFPGKIRNWLPWVGLGILRLRPDIY